MQCNNHNDPYTGEMEFDSDVISAGQDRLGVSQKLDSSSLLMTKRVARGKQVCIISRPIYITKNNEILNRDYLRKSTPFAHYLSALRYISTPISERRLFLFEQGLY